MRRKYRKLTAFAVAFIMAVMAIAPASAYASVEAGLGVPADWAFKADGLENVYKGTNNEFSIETTVVDSDETNAGNDAFWWADLALLIDGGALDSTGISTTWGIKVGGSVYADWLSGQCNSSGNGFALTNGSPVWSFSPAAGVAAGEHEFSIVMTTRSGVSDTNQDWEPITAGPFAFTVYPNAPTVTTTALPDATRGAEYSAALAASGAGADDLAFALGGSSSPLPAGLSLAADGTISGTPTAAGKYFIIVRATNTVTNAKSPTGHQVSINVKPNAPVITTTELARAYQDASYDATLAATVDTGDGDALAWTASGLPKGLALNPATGAITGIPAALAVGLPANGYARTFTATATTTNGTLTAAAEQEVSITVYPYLPAVTAGTLPGAVRGEPYTAALAATGAYAGDLAWSVAGGGLPGGLSLAGDGTISGTPDPAAAGAYPFTATARNTLTDGTDTKAFAITVDVNAAPAISTPVSGSGTVGSPFSLALGASGFPAPAWSAVGLPAGLSIDTATGLVSGTPSSPGSYFVTAKAANSSGTASVSGYITIADTPAGPPPSAGWVSKGGSWLYYDAAGAPCIGWQSVDGETRYFDPAQGGAAPQGWFSHSNGQTYYFWWSGRGVFAAGLCDIGGRTYYFNAQGHLQTGWQSVGGQALYFDPANGGAAPQGWFSHSNGQTYYFWWSGNGAFAAGLCDIGGRTYYFNAQGHLQAGWQSVGGQALYFDPAQGGAAPQGWFSHPNGNTYYFWWSGRGAFATGACEIGGYPFYFNSQGHLI
jgi:glucan-binding YG repeat protein